MEDPDHIKELMDAIKAFQAQGGHDMDALDVSLELLCNSILPPIEEQSFHISLKTDIQRAFASHRKEPNENTTYLVHDFKAPHLTL